MLARVAASRRRLSRHEAVTQVINRAMTTKPSRRPSILKEISMGEAPGRRKK